MKIKKRNIAMVSVLVVAFLVVCNQLQMNWRGGQRVTSGSSFSIKWEDSSDPSIAGVDSATLFLSLYTFADDSTLPVVLWVDSFSGHSSSSARQRGDTGYFGEGYIERDHKTKYAYKITLREGQYSLETNSSEFDLNKGSTILFKKKDGEVEVRQIALPICILFDATSLRKHAHENQEILDFYSDNQQSEGEQNETPKD